MERSGWEGLTSREREVALLVADGFTSRQVARALGVSERTVHSHLSAVLSGLGARSRAALPGLVPRPVSVGSELPPLTDRQQQVVALVALGQSNDEVAAALGVTPKTVEKHLTAVFSRWGVRSRTAVAARWLAPS
jgi:DNA-binding NarL/FixJ family response regulator